MSILKKLYDLGADITDLPEPGGSYIPVNIRGSIATVAIQFPIEKKQYKYTGSLGGNLNTTDGYKAARLCAVNILKQVTHHVKEENLVGLNHLEILYQCTKDWDEGPKIADGASELFLQLMGKKGRHTRSIWAVNKLPGNFVTGVVASFTLKNKN